MIAQNALERPWMRVFLRALAVCYAFGGLIHYTNILGIGANPWAHAPLNWKAADVAYALLDTGAAIGLWTRELWGIACFLAAAGSQLVLYRFLPHLFAFTDEHRQGLDSILLFHGVTLAVFVVLLVIEE